MSLSLFVVRSHATSPRQHVPDLAGPNREVGRRNRRNDDRHHHGHGCDRLRSLVTMFTRDAVE